MNILYFGALLYLISSWTFAICMIRLQDNSSSIKGTINNIVYGLIIVPLVFWAVLIALIVFYIGIGLINLMEKISIDE